MTIGETGCAVAHRRSSAFPAVDATDGRTWDRWADGLTPMEVAARRILVVAPHPDDETFGCGGLIAAAVRRRAEVLVVTVTDGGGSHPGRPGLPAQRRREQVAAVEALGCQRQPWWLALPDGGVTASEPDLAAQLLELAAGADLIVAPWPGDRHPDHEAAGRVAIEVAAAVGIRVVTYPVWLWRWGAPSDLAPHGWHRLLLDAEAHDAKQAAMQCYPSQTTDLLGETIVDAAMLERFARPFEIYSNE